MKHPTQHSQRYRNHRMEDWPPGAAAVAAVLLTFLALAFAAGVAVGWWTA